MPKEWLDIHAGKRAGNGGGALSPDWRASFRVMPQWWRSRSYGSKTNYRAWTPNLVDGAVSRSIFSEWHGKRAADLSYIRTGFYPTFHCDSCLRGIVGARLVKNWGGRIRGEVLHAI